MASSIRAAGAIDGGVAVAVGVLVGVSVGVKVGVDVEVEVGVGMDVEVGVGVGVGVEVGTGGMDRLPIKVSIQSGMPFFPWSSCSPGAGKDSGKRRGFAVMNLPVVVVNPTCAVRSFSSAVWEAA